MSNQVVRSWWPDLDWWLWFALNLLIPVHLFIYLMQQVDKRSEHGVILLIFIFNMQSKLLLVMHFNQIAIHVWETVSLHNVMGANKHR